MRRYTIGLIINPLAGSGGPLAQKGSDHLELTTQRLALGEHLNSLKRTALFFAALANTIGNIQWLAPEGLMGGYLLRELGIEFEFAKTSVGFVPTAHDTQALTLEYCARKVDLIVFAGGDGTAADVAEVVNRINPTQLVLGIPAGVKIQSGVFAINPTAAGLLVAALTAGGLLHAEFAQVRDLDEAALQLGQVKSRYLGRLLVPYDGRFVQSIKQGGLVAEDLIISDVAAYLEELVPDRAAVVFGPGKTMSDLQYALGLPSSLLGFDVFVDKQCLALDANSEQLAALLSGAPEPWVFLTVIGGQGHIIGRGNQQLSVDILRSIGRNAIHPIATKEKLASVGRGCLLIDSGDSELDEQWAGLIPVICGYREQVLYDLVSLPK